MFNKKSSSLLFGFLLSFLFKSPSIQLELQAQGKYRKRPVETCDSSRSMQSDFFLVNYPLRSILSDTFHDHDANIVDAHPFSSNELDVRIKPRLSPIFDDAIKEHISSETIVTEDKFTFRSKQVFGLVKFYELADTPDYGLASETKSPLFVPSYARDAQYVHASEYVYELSGRISVVWTGRHVSNLDNPKTSLTIDQNRWSGKINVNF